MNNPRLSPGAFLALLVLVYLLTWLWVYVAGRLVGSGVARSWLEMVLKNKSQKGRTKKETKNEGK